MSILGFVIEITQSGMPMLDCYSVFEECVCAGQEKSDQRGSWSANYFYYSTPKMARHKKLTILLIETNGEFEFRQDVIPDVWCVTNFTSLKQSMKNDQRKLTRKWSE